MATEALELLTHRGVMGVEQLVPAPVTHAYGPIGRPDDVGEHDGLEDPVDLVLLSGSGEELLDLVEDVLVPADRAFVEVAGKLRQSGSGYVFGDVAGVHHVDQGIAAAMNDQRGC